MPDTDGKQLLDADGRRILDADGKLPCGCCTEDCIYCPDAPRIIRATFAGMTTCPGPYDDSSGNFNVTPTGSLNGLSFDLTTAGGDPGGQGCEWSYFGTTTDFTATVYHYTFGPITMVSFSLGLFIDSVSGHFVAKLSSSDGTSGYDLGIIFSGLAAPGFVAPGPPTVPTSDPQWCAGTFPVVVDAYDINLCAPYACGDDDVLNQPYLTTGGTVTITVP